MLNVGMNVLLQLGNYENNLVQGIKVNLKGFGNMLLALKLNKLLVVC